MSHYKGDYVTIHGINVHYKTLELYVKHIHSRQDIERDDVGSICGWDMLRSNLHDMVFGTVDDDLSEEWKIQFDEFVENLFICNICKKVPAFHDWYCRECDEFVSLGDVMRRLEKYGVEHCVSA